MQDIIRTTALSHRFSGDEPVLHNIDLAVPAGSIYGFLGPNGAGKTTTLRLLLGLLRSQQGEITIFGKPFPKNRTLCLQKIGSLIESPSFYGHLTARENLKILQTIYRCNVSRIDKVLHLVGLSHTGNKKAARFSLGMKQRLGIAAALLHQPELLILDEPTNGLDPNGMIEIRELLLRLRQEEKITILISSHLLAEIEKLVTHVGIINKGAMMFQGSLQELTLRQEQTFGVTIQSDNLQLSIDIICESGIAAERSDEFVRLPALSKHRIAEVNRRLVEAGIAVFSITEERNDLESIFMNLINP